MEYIRQMLERLDQSILAGEPASVLRGYIFSLRDYLDTRKERDTTTELEILRAEIADLATQKASLSTENENLKTRLNALENPSDKLSDGATKTLKLAFDAEEAYGPFYYAQRLGITEGMAEYHLGELYEREMISIVGMGPVYVINQNGRKYVVERLS